MPTPPTRTVLHLVNRLDGGGVLRHVLDLADGLTTFGYESRVAAWVPEQAPLLNDPRFCFLPLYNRTGSRKRAIGALRAMSRLRQLVAQENISILHTHSRYALLLGQRIAAMRPHVYTLHNLFDDERAAALIPRSVIVPSSALTALIPTRMKDGSARMVHVIPHGIDIPGDWHRRERSSRVFAWIGRIEEGKGLEIVIEAMRILRSRGLEDVRLEVYGSGSQRGAMENQVKEEGLAAFVRFYGWTKAPLNRSDGVDVLIFSSLALDALGYVNLDAMARGLPVIASDLPSVDDLVLHEKTGLRYARRNAQALADAMQFAVRHPERMLAYGEAAREHVTTHYSMQGMLTRTAAVYESLLQ
ncbi:glycosyltransferase family 4 protein [bacterium]|nr:glycosyltransferase family 4 protein [bacterium]